MIQKKLLVLFVLLGCSLAGASQTIKDGSLWWDGLRLYAAVVDAQGNVRMEGESEEMGGDSFLLNKVAGTDGRYTLESTSKYGWLSIRGRSGFRVDYVRQEGMNFLAVRKPNGDCCHTLVLTPDNLKNCVLQQKIAEEREVSWMLQNYLMNIYYLGRFSKAQLRLMRNEILARHGWKFQSKDLRDYFSDQPWYKPGTDNNNIKLSIIEMTNIQLIKSEEAEDDGNRVRYENTTAAPKMVEAVDGVITVTTEEQFLNALGNNRIVEIGTDVHLNLSRILEQEDKFAGVPGRAWVTIVERGGDQPVIVSDFVNDGHELSLKNFRNLVIRGQYHSSIEVAPRYAFCLNLVDCENCRVENLTIGHTEEGYCDGGVIGVEGGSGNIVTSCDLYGCGTYGIVARDTRNLLLEKTNIHDCTYGIMELYSSERVTFNQCDFFNNREYELISIRGCEGVEFNDCRFYANWAKVPLFVADANFTMNGCKVYHPILGAQARIVAPKHDNLFGDDAAFIPEPREEPIGPDVSNYNRSDFTFKATKVKNADGDYSEVKFCTYAKGKLVDEYTFEMAAPLSEDMVGTIGEFSEQDLNFDGYPDVDVYMGYYGGFSNNTQHEALLWDQQRHCFVYPDGYAGIGEPQLDSEKKCIYTTLSAGPAQRVTSYYRWQGHKLQLYLENTWSMEDDEYVNFDGMLNLPVQRYDAKLDGRIPVTIAFQRNTDNTVAGYIYYPNAKNPAPIMIVGSATEYNGKDIYGLTEFQPDGKASGFITLEHDMKGRWDDKVEGTWTNPKTEKQMQITDVMFRRECPTWFTKSLLTPEDPANIGREYSFQQWRQGYDEYLGGHITFRAAGKNKVHFECANVVRNLAEGRSAENRPAVLEGNTFEYRDVNECGYGFRATFYPKFVVLKSITDGETLECFGAWSSFDGIYIKIKQ